mgnify:CR=1 FL=1
MYVKNLNLLFLTFFKLKYLQVYKIFIIFVSDMIRIIKKVLSISPNIEVPSITKI